MTPKEAEEIRTRNNPKAKKGGKRLASPKEAPSAKESTLPDHPVPEVDPMADNAAQRTSVIGGAMGQSWGLPRPMTAEEAEAQTSGARRSDRSAEKGGDE
jgi:hypothetical protein